MGQPNVGILRDRAKQSQQQGLHMVHIHGSVGPLRLTLVRPRRSMRWSGAGGIPILSRHAYRLKIVCGFAAGPSVWKGLCRAGLLLGHKRYFQKSSTTSGFSLKIQASVSFPSLMWAMWV
jgi:hypothetical protein